MRASSAVVAAAPLLALLLPRAAAAAAPPLARHTCANGLEVVVAENHATPLMTIEIAVHNGAMTEPPEYNGLSHLYEHMFFKGNAAMPDELAANQRARELGIESNGMTNTERVNYFFTTSSDHFAPAMAFMRDAIVTPLFDRQELERERVVVTGEIDRAEANPNYYLWHTIEQHLFWKYPSRKDPVGNRATVLSATVEKLRTLQHRYYVPNNSVLVVTGDVHAADVFAVADKLYASWARAADPFAQFPLVTHPPIPKSEVVLVPQPVENVTAIARWQGPSASDSTGLSATYAADVLTTLANNSASRFQRALVDSGLCVSAWLSYLTQRNVGELTVMYEAVPEKAEACASAVFAQLPKLRSGDYFGDDEIANAKHRIEVHEAEQRETTEGLAHAITFAWAVASVDYYETYVGNVRAVGRDDLAKVLDGWMLGKPFVLGVMASPKVIAAGLDVARLGRATGMGGGQ